MFFLTTLLLTSQFCLMSDRAHFWDSEKLADRTLFYQSSPEKVSLTLEKKEIEGKNILLLVHGYNNNALEALSTYQLINTNISKFGDSKYYDLIIGYLWPGDDVSIEYYNAKSRARKVAQKLRSHLEFLGAFAARIDLLAHSMGNLVVLEALDYQSSNGKKILQNYYALAPAVDDESIEKKEKYYSSTQNCAKVFVLFSKRDEVLKWLYSAAEWDLALGYQGAEDKNRLPSNVQLLNYTNLIASHSQYFSCPSFYKLMKDQFSPSSVQNKNSGEIVAIQP